MFIRYHGGLAVLMVSLMLTIAGCGGGGDGGTQTQQQPTTAVLKLATQGVPSSGSALAGISITVTLPTTVKVPTDGTGAVSAVAVTVSGVAGTGAVMSPVYVAPTGTTPGKLSFVMASSLAAGFPAGEFATVTCNLVGASLPAATEFSLSDFSPVDVLGNVVTGLTPTYTMATK